MRGVPSGKNTKSKPVESACDNKRMADIVSAAKDLDANSKIELFNYMATIGINYMENANGVFFSLTNLTDESLADVKRKLDELKSYEELTNLSFANKKSSDDAGGGYASSEDTYPSGGQEGFADTEDGQGNENDVDVDDLAKVNKNGSRAPCSFEYDEAIMKTIEKTINRNSKKNIHSKYSIAKKKYNKPFASVDTKKIDGTDLSELSKEPYIVI